MSDYRNNGDEIPIYASIPYETSEMNETTINESLIPNYQTMSLKASYNHQATLISIIKQKLINILQAIEMTNVNSYPFYLQEEPDTPLSFTDIKVWLLCTIIIICLATLIAVTILIVKLNSVLP